MKESSNWFVFILFGSARRDQTLAKRMILNDPIADWESNRLPPWCWTRSYQRESRWTLWSMFRDLWCLKSKGRWIKGGPSKGFSSRKKQKYTAEFLPPTLPKKHLLALRLMEKLFRMRILSAWVCNWRINHLMNSPEISANWSSLVSACLGCSSMKPSKVMGRSWSGCCCCCLWCCCSCCTGKGRPSGICVEI